jgi:hypothetical protein
MSITSVLAVHTPLLILHCNWAVLPAGTPVTVVVGELGLVIVAVPPNKLQLPIPFTGVLPDIKNVPVLHC